MSSRVSQVRDDSDVPPNDLDAEGAVLSALLLAPDLFERVRDSLRDEHFYSNANRRIYQAIVALSNGGHAIDVLTVTSWLRARDRLQQVGGPSYLVQLSDATPAVAHVEEHAAIVVQRSLERRAKDRLKQARVELGAPGADVLAIARAAVDDLTPLIETEQVHDAWNTASTQAIFSAPLVPLQWAVEGLGIGPGRPCGLWGKATGGKTLEAIDIAVSKATGTPVYGRFEVERGPVLWVSYDFPSRPLHTRFRQIANGRGLSLADLDGMIETCVFPSIYLNSPGAEPKFAQRCKGFDLVILDCYRDAIPGTEENSSEQAVYLKSLARIGEAQGNTFLYLHHLKKGGDDDESTIDSGRGSGAIAAASGAIWALEGTGSKPRLMRNVRPHDSNTEFVAPFYIELVTGGSGTFPCDQPPIRLVARTLAEMKGEAFFAQVELNKSAAKERLAFLVRLVSSHPNCTMTQLRQHTRGTLLASKDVLKDTVDEALGSDPPRIVKTEVTRKGGTAHVFNIAPNAPTESS